MTGLGSFVVTCQSDTGTVIRGVQRATIHEMLLLLKTDRCYHFHTSAAREYNVPLHLAPISLP